jgi:superfamily II DNA or RNA helicase
MTLSTSDNKFALEQLRPIYRTGTANLGRDFFGPCLGLCVSYDRAAGYFSSSALRIWSGALIRIIRESVRIRLLVSPELTDADVAALRGVASEEERSRFLDRHSDSIVSEAISFAKEPDDVKKRLLLLAWMIANGQLDLRFAIPRHMHDPGIFHDKSGIFTFPEHKVVAFAGSANETFSGYTLNTEKLLVFRSWEAGDRGHLDGLQKDFDEMWGGAGGTLLVNPLSEATMASIRAVAPHERPRVFDEIGDIPTAMSNRWRHQIDAKNAFLTAKDGVLEMATGTGKTRTALMICEELLDANRITGIVIAVDGTDLLDQWSKTLLAWIFHRSDGLRLLRQYADYHQAQAFALNPHGAVLIISRSQLTKVFSMLPATRRHDLLIIHDEVHGLGAPQLRLDLSGQHHSFAFRLGLSATPEREYDAEGTAFIDREIGPVIYKFGIEEAIRNGILSEFDYVPLTYFLTQDDRSRLQAVYAKKAARIKAGDPMSQEEVWMELARVYKTAEEKPLVFADYLRNNPDVVKGAILFVEERWFGDELLPTLAQYTDLYRTYYADDERVNLLSFAAGRIDCLVTCHRISQGIDIKSLRAVVLFASARSKLETIPKIPKNARW